MLIYSLLRCLLLNVISEQLQPITDELCNMCDTTMLLIGGLVFKQHSHKDMPVFMNHMLNRLRRWSSRTHQKLTYVCVRAQDFADELDVMPSITLENNVIHNNEGYGVILVKPNTGDQHRAPLDSGEGRQQFPQSQCDIKDSTESTFNLLFLEDPAGQTAEDRQPGGVSDHPLTSTSSSSSSAGSTTAAVQPESTEHSNSTDGDLAPISGRKWQFSRQLSRNKEMSCSRAVQDLTDHQIFVSIQGNQFKRNGMGDFGTFFY